MGSAEGGEEVIQRHLIGRVGHRDRRVGFEAVGMEKIVPSA